MDKFIIENNKQQAILQSLSKIFVSVHMIDIKKQTYYKVSCADYVDNVLKQFPVAQDAFDKVVEYLVLPSYADRMTEFLNISTLQERLKEQDVIMCDFVGSVARWSRGYFMVLTRDENNLAEQVVFAVQNIDKEKSREENLRKLSETDGLTGLLNRHALKNYFKSVEDTDVTMVMMDIDHFKNFNDSFGHDVGDIVIQTCATVIKEEFEGCKCYRYGGDEYLILAVDCDEKQLLERLDRTVQKVQEKKIREDIPAIEMSYGVLSGHPANQEEIDVLFRQVDRLLYEEKKRRAN